MSQFCDVIIIGGGIIGNSISAHLAESTKLKIVVINSTSLGAPASIAAAGLLTPFQLHELENPFLKDFCFKSFEYFLDFYEKIKTSLKMTDINLGFKQTGSLYLIFSNSEIPQKENGIKEFKTKVSFLNKQECYKIEPLLTKEVIGAYYFSNESVVNNPKFLKALMQYSQERSIEYLNTQVTDITIKNTRIESITLANSQTLSAKKYILCNGAWADILLAKIFNKHENIISAVKGEILQVEAVNGLPLERIMFCKEGYVLPRPATNAFEKDSILVGSTFDESDIKENKNLFKNTISGISFLSGLFKTIFPECKDYPVVDFWSGLRPKTKDNLPILGKAEEIDNLFLALGHYRNGILMGPLTGKIISDLVLGNTVEHNIEPFKIERFFKSLVNINH